MQLLSFGLFFYQCVCAINFGDNLKIKVVSGTFSKFQNGGWNDECKNSKLCYNLIGAEFSPIL